MKGSRVTVPAKIKSPIDSAGRPRGGGKPTLCVPEGYEPLLGLLRMGMYVQQACNIVGIAKDTIYDWLKRGASGEEPYATFASAYEKAAAQAEMVALSDIRAGKSNWQARAWFLERRFRDRWGRYDNRESLHRMQRDREAEGGDESNDEETETKALEFLRRRGWTCER